MSECRCASELYPYGPTAVTGARESTGRVTSGQCTSRHEVYFAASAGMGAEWTERLTDSQYKFTALREENDVTSIESFVCDQSQPRIFEATSETCRKDRVLA